MSGDLLHQVYWGNRVLDWAIALGVALGAFLILLALRRVVGNRIAKVAEGTGNRLDDFIAELIRRTKLFFLALVAAWVGALFVELPGELRRIGEGGVVVVLLLQGAIWASAILRVLIDRARKIRREKDPGSLPAVNAVGFLLQLALWSVVALVFLDNVGVDVTTLVAGLGISGIAVALALQNILGDLFSSFSIMLDRPFVVGDFIIVDDHMGTVEQIGVKTTRIRSLGGEQLVFSNGDLLRSRIRNYKRMFERRIIFGFGVLYETPAEKLESIPGMVKEIVQAQSNVRFDRAHFKKYGDSSLDFEVVYYVLVPDYNVYMDIQQAINLALFRKIKQEGVGFAYPTRTLHLAGGTIGARVETAAS